MFHQWRAFWRLQQAQALACKDRDRALIAYRQLLEFAPQYAYAYYHFARYWVEGHDWQQAEQNIDQSISLVPQHPIFHAYRGVIAYYQKNYEKALQSLQHSLTLDSQNQLTQNYLALVHLALNHQEEFHKILEQAGLFESLDLQIELLLSLEKRAACANQRS